MIDSGVGISTKELKKIFLPFEQIGSKFDLNHSDGTGLGLPITQQLLALMGSKLLVKSEVGKGSRFWFELTLPVMAAAVNTQATKQSQLIGYQGQKRTILIVDDKPQNLLILHEMLKPIGFEIIEAKNGQEAVTLTHQSRPDLVLMDLAMPIMNGIIRKQMDEIEELDAKYAPFATKVRDLARGFAPKGHDKDEEIVALVERCIKINNVNIE